MAETRVVNLKNETCDVAIDRTTIFGNPFTIGGDEGDGTRSEVIAKYKVWLLKRMDKDETFALEVDSLKGKVLGCHCKPLPCHGDVLVAYLNGEFDQEIEEGDDDVDD